jgi:hypothetical protein
MPWSVQRKGSTLRVEISVPIENWEALMDEIQANLKPVPKAIVLPSEVPGASATDKDLLKMLWAALVPEGIPPPAPFVATPGLVTWALAS